MARVGLMLLVVLGVIGLVEGNIAWFNQGPAGGDDSVDCSVGAISGALGCVRGWDVVTSQQHCLVTDADLGGHWAPTGSQSQLELRQNSGEVEDTHYHYYIVDTGENDYATIQAQAIQTLNSDGSCGQYDIRYPQWWWIPFVDYDDGGITIEVANSNDGIWVEQAWDFAHHNDPANYLSGDPSQGYPQAGAGSQAGEIRVASALPVGLPLGSNLRVGFNWEVSGSANVDNATVQQWLEGVFYTAYSSLSESEASEDFDLESLLE